MKTTFIRETETHPTNYTGILKIRYYDGHILTITMKDGYWHSYDDQPAWDDGGRGQIWYKMGLRHRVCKPAEIAREHEYYYIDDVPYFVNTSPSPTLSTAIHNYWKACWQYRTPENEHIIAAKLLASNSE